MSVKTRAVVLVVLLALFTGAVSAQQLSSGGGGEGSTSDGAVFESGFEGDDPGWYKYDDGASSFTYDTDYTNDVYAGSEAGRARKGEGLCGYGGMAHDFLLEGQPDRLELSFKGWLESWGAGPAIFVRNSSGYYDIWVMRDDTQYGSGSGGWTDWTTETFDISGAGRNFTLILGNKDTGGHCSNFDHGWEIRADNVTVTTAEEGPGPVCSGCSTPTDPDGDGLYEDVNGDGDVADNDATILHHNLSQASAEYFDFNDDGNVDSNDPQSLAEEIHPDLACSDVSSDAAVVAADADDDGLISLSEVQDAANDYSEGRITPTESLYIQTAWESDCEVSVPDFNVTSVDVGASDDGYVVRAVVGWRNANDSTVGVRLDARPETNSISVDGTGTAGISWGMDGLDADTVAVIIDPGDEFDELNESNNRMEAAVDTGPVPVCTGCPAPTDPDGDGLYEDVNGDGEMDFEDIEVLLENLNDVHPRYFGFASTAEMTVFDVSELSDEFMQEERVGRFVLDDGERANLKSVDAEVRLQSVDIVTAVLTVSGETMQLDEGETRTIEGGELRLLESRPVPESSGGQGIAVMEWTPEDTMDLAVETIDIEALSDGSYRVTSQVRNTGAEVKAREDFDISFIPPRDYDVLDDSGAVREKYVLENGLNEISWTLDPGFIPAGTELSVDTGENTSVDLGGEEHTIGVRYLMSADEAVTVIDGQRYLLEEGGTVDVSDRILKVQDIIQTEDSSGVVMFAVGSEAEETLEVGIELDPGDRLDEADETNNRLVGTIELEKNQTDEGTVELHPGWNMISSPYRDAGLYIDDVTDDCQLEEFGGEVSWQLEGGSWTHPGAVSPIEGVFVRSAETCTATIDRDRWSDGSASSAGVLEAGWNIISVPEPMPLNQMVGTCEFQEFEGSPVWHYQAEFGAWQRLGQSGTLYPARGYYVTVSERCELSSDADSDSPPTPTGNMVRELMDLLG